MMTNCQQFNFVGKKKGFHIAYVWKMKRRLKGKDSEENYRTGQAQISVELSMAQVQFQIF